MSCFARARWGVLGTVLLGLCSPASAQNPTRDVTIKVFAKPEGRQLHLLFRVPFQAFSGVNVPSGASGQLNLARTEAMLPSVARWWIADNFDVYEGATLLPKPRVTATRVSLPSDDAFGVYDRALAHILGPKLPEATQLFRDQAMLDVLLDYDLRAADSRLAIRSRLASLASRVTTELEFVPPGSTARRFEYTGDPGRFDLDPSLGQTLRRFAASGFWRVLQGTDYLLFLFCVALQLSGMRAMAGFAASFAFASSLSLLASGYNLALAALWFPVFIEALIALSILYMAFENMAGFQLVVRRKWVVAVSLGVIYGLGFALQLAPLRQFAGSHALASVVFFAAGIDAGVLTAAAILAAALLLFFRLTSGGPVSRRTETVVLSVLAADLAWHRLTDRVERLSQFRFQWPAIDAALLAEGMRWLTAVLIAGGVVCIVVALRRQCTARKLRASNYAADAAGLSKTQRPGGA